MRFLGGVGFHAHCHLRMQHDTGSDQPLLNLRRRLRRRQAGYADAAQKAERYSAGIGHPVVLFISGVS